MLGSCKHGNEGSDFVKSGEFVDWLGDCWLLAVQDFHFIWAVLNCIREYGNMEMNESCIFICILT